MIWSFGFQVLESARLKLNVAEVMFCAKEISRGSVAFSSICAVNLAFVIRSDVNLQVGKCVPRFELFLPR